MSLKKGRETRVHCVLSKVHCFSFLFLQLKQRQSEILQFLDAKKIKYSALDIAGSGDLKEEMRKKVGDPSAMPPQVFNGDKYCGVSLICF